MSGPWTLSAYGEHSEQGRCKSSQVDPARSIPFEYDAEGEFSLTKDGAVAGRCTVHSRSTYHINRLIATGSAAFASGFCGAR